MHARGPPIPPPHTRTHTLCTGVVSSHPDAALTGCCCWVGRRFFVSIVLLNVLIALMNDSYVTSRERAEVVAQ